MYTCTVRGLCGGVFFLVSGAASGILLSLVRLSEECARVWETCLVQQDPAQLIRSGQNHFVFVCLATQF